MCTPPFTRRTISNFGIFLFFILPHFSGDVLAQSEVDSLDQLLSRYTTRDTLRVNILNQAGYSYWVVDPGKSERYGQEALALAEKVNFKNGAAMANRVIGVSHWARGNFYLALVHLFKSHKQYAALHDLLGEGNTTLNIGLVYSDQMDYKEALSYFFRAQKIFETLKKEERLATTYTKIGTVYTDQKKYEVAYQYLINALNIHQKNNYVFGILEVCNRLGILYRDQGNYEEAEKYLQQSLSLAEQRQDREHIAKNLENLGSIYLQKGNVVQAEKYLLRGYAIADKRGYKKWLRDITLDLKNLYTLTGNDKSALFYFEKYEYIKDSIFNEEKAKQVAKLQIDQEIKEKEQNLRLRKQQIMLLQEQARFDRFVTTVLIGMFVFLALVAYIILRNQKFRIKKNQEMLANNRQLYQSRQALAETQLENARLKEEELNLALSFKNKELTSYTMSFIHKNELLEELREKLEKLKKQVDTPLAKEFNNILRLVQTNQSIDRDWEDFKRTFENVHHQFFSDLVSQCPELTPTELKLCALIKLNLTPKEVASIMGISPDSVKTSRYRLRKKLGLVQDQTLTDFIMGFSGATPVNT
jgi:tetratricopeptide (TPR) repeat protein/DNA-binding CsgD family transcriptional regulator